jgi:hypothetical protein
LLDKALRDLAVVFAITVVVAIIAYALIRFNIVEALHRDMNNIAELIFSVPRKFTQDYPAFQKCLDSGGASLLESGDSF